MSPALRSGLGRAMALLLVAENRRLAARARFLSAVLSTCTEEKECLEKELSPRDRDDEALEQRLKALQKGILRLRLLRDERKREVESEARVLGRCLRRQNPGLVHRLAKIADLGLRKRRFTPGRLIRDMGWDYALGHRCITILRRIGVFRREKHGRYVANPGMDRENLEEEIARRLALHAGEKGVQDNP